MKFLAGFVGAIIGAILGGITIYLIAAELGDTLGFFMAEFGIPALVVGAICGTISALAFLRHLQKERPTALTHRKFYVILSGIFAGLFALAWGMVRAADAKLGPPADETLVRDFSSHEAFLNQIAFMAQQDKQQLTSPKMHLPASRLAEYFQLLNEAHTQGQFFNMDASGEIDFDYYGNGSAISSDTNEGYAYLPRPPAHLVNNLDDYQFNEHDDDQKAYRHIHGYWYLYREYEPG